MRLRSELAALAIALLAVAATAGGPSTAGGASTGGNAGDDNALRRSATGEPQTLDPQLWVYGQDGNLAQDMFQSLTAVDAAANTVPGQAKSWTVSPDGLTYTFALRANLQWSDGHPISSADFLYSFRRLFDPRTAAPSASLLYVIKNARAVNTGKLPVDRLGVSTPDASTIVIALEHPAPYLTDIMVHRAFPVPRHVVEKFGREWTRPGNMVSNGPFKLAQWRVGSYVKLVRNERFHQASQVKLDAVYHMPVEDPASALRRFRSGELDIVVSLPSEQIEQLKLDFGSQLHLVQQIGLEYYVFNTRRAPFNDERVRRALSMAIERPVIGTKILHAGEPAAYCLVPPGVLNYPQGGCADFSSWSRARRLQEARRLLAAAGFGADKSLLVHLRYNNADTQRKIAVAVASIWQELGVRTELITAEMKVHQMALAQGDFDVARAQWYAEDRDPVSFLELLATRARGLNVSGWSDSEYDQLLELAERATDLGKRAQLMRQAEARAMQAQAAAPLYYYVSRRLIGSRVQGWVDNPRGVNVQRYLSLTNSISSPAGPRITPASRP